MAADRVDILIEQGTDFLITVDVRTGDGTPWDLTGYTAKAAMRQNFADPAAALTFTCAITNAALGVVTVAAAKTLTAAIPNTIPLGFWEFDVVSGAGVQNRIFEGLARVSFQATR